MTHDAYTANFFDISDISKDMVDLCLARHPQSELLQDILVPTQQSQSDEADAANANWNQHRGVMFSWSILFLGETD